MKEYNGVIKNIAHSIVVDGITYTTPVYDLEYTCEFENDGTFYELMCNKYEGVDTIPHIDKNGWMCTGKDFIKIINEAYNDKELIHIVCERFFVQYNEKDPWGTPRVLRMCGFMVYYWSVDEYNFKQLLEEYDYYYISNGDPILKLTHDCKDELISRNVHFIKRKQQ